MSEVLPLQQKKRGAKKVLGVLKGGTKSFEVVLTRELEVLAIVMGGEGGNLGQYDSLGQYCGPHTAYSVFLILGLPGALEARGERLEGLV